MTRRRNHLVRGSGEVVLYKAPGGQISLDVRLDHDMIWLTQAQMAELVDHEWSVITKHVTTLSGRASYRRGNVQNLHIASSRQADALGEENLRMIARELVKAVRPNVTIDWAVRENVRAQLRVIVKRILRKYGYPPDKQDKATQTVLEQAEVLCEGWAVA